MKFNYGDKVRDTITGYKGVITAYAHFYGKQEDIYLVESKDEMNTPIYKYIEEPRLEKVNDDDQ